MSHKAFDTAWTWNGGFSAELDRPFVRMAANSKEKDVALAFGVIVSKFALSVAVVYWLTRPSTRDWFASVPTEGGPSGVTVQGLSLARLTFESAFESPLAFFAMGLGVVLPAAVIAAWVETRTNGDTLDSFE